jgi:hypothetical protein
MLFEHRAYDINKKRSDQKKTLSHFYPLLPYVIVLRRYMRTSYYTICRYPNNFKVIIIVLGVKYIYIIYYVHLLNAFRNTYIQEEMKRKNY